MPPTPTRRSTRLAAEEETIRAEARESAGRRSGVDARLAEADAELNAAEKIFSELTTALADLTARRNQLETAAREHGERTARLEAEIAEIERELAGLQAEAGPDLAALGAAVEELQAAVAAAETAAVEAETAHGAARQQLEAARSPLAEAERRVQRLETEAKTLSKVLAVETKNLWPPVMDHIAVEKGYEKALGAALGDDLDAPVDPSAPMRWMGSPVDAADPALPEGVETLADKVQAPAELARRLAQIGVVDRDTGNRLVGHAQARPAAGLAGRRSVALGRLRRRRACADRRRPASGRARPPRRDRGRTADGPRRSRQRPRPGRSGGGGLQAAAAAEAESAQRRARPPAGAPMPRATATRPPSARPAATPRGFPPWPRRARA